MDAPFPPLASGAEGLDRAPGWPTRLRARMGAVYGVDAACVLPVRGRLHALELALRRAALDGVARIDAPEAPELAPLARLYGVSCGRDAAALRVVDESLIEFGDAASRAVEAASARDLIVIRSLEYAYGLAGAPCAALIAAPELIARLEAVLEPGWMPAPIERLALAALDPSRIAATERRIGEVKAERARVAAALQARGVAAEQGEGPFVLAALQDGDAARVAQFAVRGAAVADGRFRIDIAAAPDVNDRALAAFGVETLTRSRRRAEIVRDTKETRIVAQVDLDAPGPVQIATGVGYFDHMLEQVAAHGGFALSLDCAGDLHIDAHHSIEDCALALGQALKEALGERRGIARFGFVLPMDEAEAKVSIDLGGRAYLVFDGAFAAPALGAYPTEMTEHVFRSLAQSMGAAIHVSVAGDNDHHKTEACFKALGRALRQAIRIEGEAIPSTKGAL